MYDEKMRSSAYKLFSLKVILQDRRGYQRG